jgi:hypothetical protein
MSDDDVRVISPSATSPISILLNENIPSPVSPSLISPSGNVLSSASSISISSPSSSSEPSLYTSERLCHLLKFEKNQYDIINSKATTATGCHWSVFGFPAKFNKETNEFERIPGFASCRICKKTFVYGPNSGTSHMKRHSCVTYEAKASTSTPTRSPKGQQTIDKMVVIRKTLTTEQSNLIKDLTVRWVCGDIRPISIIDDEGLRALIQECVRLGMCCSHQISLEFSF